MIEMEKQKDYPIKMEETLPQLEKQLHIPARNLNEEEKHTNSTYSIPSQGLSTDEIGGLLRALRPNHTEWYERKERLSDLQIITYLLECMQREEGKNDLRHTVAPEIALNLKAFICFILLSVNDIPPQAYFALLIMCCSFLCYQAKNLTVPFDFQFGNSTNAPHSLLNLVDAFSMFLPEITHITRFMLVYLTTLMLAWPLQLGVQFLIGLLLISAPLYYFPQLVAKASGTNVACGPFKLPLIWFTTLGALALSLICVLLTLLVIYLSWRYIYKGKPRVKELKASIYG